MKNEFYLMKQIRKLILSFKKWGKTPEETD